MSALTGLNGLNGLLGFGGTDGAEFETLDFSESDNFMYFLLMF